MSKLDSFIRRMSAQRDCLNHVARKIENVTGPVLELGLGNGRTYDHLREKFGAEDVYVFDRQKAAHPDYCPDDDHMVLGDFTETLKQVADRLPEKARLAHCDIGTGDKVQSMELANLIVDDLDLLLTPGAYIVSDQPFDRVNWIPQPLPEEVAVGRYHIYRKD
ncbi:hypothetical protein GUA87_05020 [Sneathiella sp. P13V-1]|uniref:class I SAM-dependent methyltransferase n=1 Tax=Sneathiella sp. P13V-1 TaxID=2697366 RepID=UPI00187B273A|nr:class I SAM-dependent methyltransferase [Sneathiella sp. P13V-1]MBE7636195.1 hypothetical protein [Sneathiella sp. P13V-1]